MTARLSSLPPCKRFGPRYRPNALVAIAERGDAVVVLKGKLEIIPEIVGVTLMVALGTFVLRRALKTDAADSLARLPIVGAVIGGTEAVLDEAYAG
jgi:hypothetical protein